MKRTLKLIPGLPTKKLLAAIREHLRGGDTARRALAFYLLEMEKGGGYQSVGHSSTVNYAEGDLGLKRREARDLLRIARALEELKAIDGAFAEDGGGMRDRPRYLPSAFAATGTLPSPQAARPPGRTR